MRPYSQQVQRTGSAPRMKVGERSVNLCPATQPASGHPTLHEVRHDPPSPCEESNRCERGPCAPVHKRRNLQDGSGAGQSDRNHLQTELRFQHGSQQAVRGHHRTVGYGGKPSKHRQERRQCGVLFEQRGSVGPGASGSQTRGAGEVFFGGILEEQGSTSLL